MEVLVLTSTSSCLSIRIASRKSLSPYTTAERHIGSTGGWVQGKWQRDWVVCVLVGESNLVARLVVFEQLIRSAFSWRRELRSTLLCRARAALIWPAFSRRLATLSSLVCRARAALIWPAFSRRLATLSSLVCRARAALLWLVFSRRLPTLSSLVCRARVALLWSVFSQCLRSLSSVVCLPRAVSHVLRT